MEDPSVPIASPAAWSPHAAPRPVGEQSRILTLDPSAAPEQEEDTRHANRSDASGDRLTALRDIARKLSTAPDSADTLQFVIDTACKSTRSEAGMLTLNAPQQQQVVHGSALGAGPYISLQLRDGGPSFGEMVLTRMAGDVEFRGEDQIFAELVAETIGKAVSSMRAGTVLSQEEQDFVDRITEEVRAPIASAMKVLGAVLGGQAGELPEVAETYLTRVAAHGDRTLTSIDNLMMLAHLRPPEARQMVTIPVAAWLQSAADRWQERAAARDITMTVRLPAEPVMMQGMPAQLDAVADQLLSNAIKFTDEAGKVDLTAGPSEGAVRITVSDSGMGFDPSEANRLADCFARGTNAEAARVPGMGVGLHLADHIVRNHTGRLWLESRDGEGTQAHVLIPLAPDA